MKITNNYVWKKDLSLNDLVLKQDKEIERLKEELEYTIPIVEHNKTITKHLKEIERLNKIRQQVIDELFDLKNMIYKPETREINFDVQNKISSIIIILGGDKE